MVATLNSPAARGTTFTADQMAALLAAAQQAGGQIARPLPRLDPQVPFGPGIPLNPAPINPLDPTTGRAQPRQYEYPVTFNLPGFGDRLVPWKVLRDAADLITLFRRCIEIRKAEVATLDWDVTISAKAIERAQRQDPNTARKDIEKGMRERVEPHIGRLVDLWETPDQINGLDFIGWACKVLEEYFVLDAIAMYPTFSRGGDFLAFDVLDGTTIKPLLDSYGRRPRPPQPAFQQILYGFPRGEFVADGEPDPETGALPGAYPADRLVYKVHNVRTFTPYGFSAVEQALSDGELFARRMSWLKAEYTEGTMPSGWIETDPSQGDWSPAMLREFETAFNDWFAGNTAARQRHRILPPGMKAVESSDLNERYRPDYDLHLIKLVGSHFDTTIAELGFTETGGLGSTGWHEGQADVQDRKATQPTLRRLQALCTALMRRYLGAPPELEFRILGLESEDEDAADEVSDRRIKRGAMTLNEDRDRTGLPRYSFPEADMPMVDTGRGVVFLEGASKLAAPGVMIGPPQAPPLTGQPGEPQAPGQSGPAGGSGADGPPTDPAKPNPDAVKAELAAYRRWLAKGNTSRPFRFDTITKAQAAAAGVELDKAEFAEGVAGRAPKVRHWPGWERDLQVAEHWATRLESALTGIASASSLVSEARRVFRHGRDAVAAVIAHHDWASALVPILQGIWTDGYVVGTLSAQAVLAHHQAGMVKADTDVATVTLGVDWGLWRPGDEEAARQILGSTGALDHLLDLVDTGDVVADRIVVSRMDRLASVLIDGLEKGQAPAAIARRLEPILRDKQWAHLVSLTETTRAVSAATLLRYARNGVDAKEWMTALDQRVCALCSGNEDEGVIPLGQAFGTGDAAPPAHPLCRCSISPAWLTADEAAVQGVGPDLTGLGAAEDLSRPVARLGELSDEEIAADPAMKMKVAELKALAKDNNVPLYGATKKQDIVHTIRQWESDKLKSGGKVLLPDGPIGKPITFKPEPIVAPPLGVPAASPVLSGAALNDWADYFRHDFEQGRFQFVDAAGNTAAEGVRVRDLRTFLGRPGEYGDYVVDTGTAWRFDGVSYLVQHSEADYGAPWVSRAFQDLRDAHAAIPAAERANRSYAVLSGHNPADSYWARKYGRPDFNSAMTAGGGRINIWRFKDTSRVEVDLLRHETGHNLDALMAPGSRMSISAEWSQAAAADRRVADEIRGLTQTVDGSALAPGVDWTQGFPLGVTSYGQADAAEDFAESVRLYQMGPIAVGRLPGMEIAELPGVKLPFGAVAITDREVLYFRDLFPARAKILDKEFPDIAREQKAAIEALRAPKPVEPADLSRMTVAQLKQVAKDRGVTIPSGARKQGILDLLQGKASAEQDLSRMTVTQLRAVAKDRGLTGYSKLTKPQLLERLSEAPVKTEAKMTGYVGPKFELKAQAEREGVSKQELSELRRVLRSQTFIPATLMTETEQAAGYTGNAWLDQFAKNHPAIYNHVVQERRMAENWAYGYKLNWPGKTLAEAKEAAAARFSAVVADQPIVIRRATEARLRQALDDGRLKTQFETGTSSGILSTEVRTGLEQMDFGLPADLNPAERPVYGFVSVGGVRAASERQVVDMYGQIQLVLKDEVKTRTTVSNGDSLNVRDEIRPAPINQIDWRATGTAQIGDRADYGAMFERSGYIEAQIHGGVKMSDIAEIIFPKEPEPATVQSLAKAGIPWRVLKLLKPGPLG